jgi:hypothetical protein
MRPTYRKIRHKRVRAPGRKCRKCGNPVCSYKEPTKEDVLCYACDAKVA